MRKSLATIVAGTVLALAVPAGLYAASAATSGATFKLTYRGLDTPDDPLNYGSTWAFGGRQEDTSFITDVKKRVETYKLVFNAMLPQEAQWSLVELKDDKPVAFYFDVNADGKFSDNEKIAPAPHGPDFGYECAFITPDLMLHTEDQKEAPFRIMLIGWNTGANISYMWSSCCLLEGRATLAGEPTRMIVYPNGPEGSFSMFRRCSLSLVRAGMKITGSLPRQNLSSLIYYKDTFYRLRLVGTHAKGETLSVVLEKDTTPTGNFKTELIGAEPLKSRLTSASIKGAKDDTIYFRIGDNRTTFPAGAYRLGSGYVTYGTKDDDEWRVDFSNGPAFDVVAGETNTIKLGDLNLSVSAMAQNDRNRPNVKPTTTFAKGTVINITRQITGKAGEAFGRFTRKTSDTERFEDVKPHVTITSADGKEIASADLAYG